MFIIHYNSSVIGNIAKNYMCVTRTSSNFVPRYYVMLLNITFRNKKT